MKVILCEEVENLGNMGETVNVANGYARNYLIPRKLAVGAESASAKQIEHEMAIIRRREEKRRVELGTVAKKLEGITLEFQMRAGEEDKLFGSVTNVMVAEKLAELGHEIDRKNIRFEEAIKSLGIFTVDVRLASGIVAQIKVWVTGLAEEAAPAEEVVEASEESE